MPYNPQEYIEHVVHIRGVLKEGCLVPFSSMSVVSKRSMFRRPGRVVPQGSRNAGSLLHWAETRKYEGLVKNIALLPSKNWNLDRNLAGRISIWALLPDLKGKCGPRRY